MCGPMAALGLGMSAASSVVGFMGEQEKAKRHNEMVLQNAQNASLAASDKYTDEQKKYIYDSRQIQQEGYGAALKGRAAGATALASAGASGFDASSISVGALLAGEAQKTAQSLDNIKTKQDDLEASFQSRVKTAEAEAKARTNSMQMQAGPSPLALGLNIVNSGLGAMKGSM